MTVIEAGVIFLAMLLSLDVCQPNFVAYMGPLHDLVDTNTVSGP